MAAAVWREGDFRDWTAAGPFQRRGKNGDCGTATAKLKTEFRGDEMSELVALYDEATQLKNAGDLAGAVGKLQEILAIDENYVLAHTALAVHLQKLGQNEAALKHAKKVVELEPNDPFSHAQLSVISQRCGRITEAEDALAHSNRMGAGGCSTGGCGH